MACTILNRMRIPIATTSTGAIAELLGIPHAMQQRMVSLPIREMMSVGTIPRLLWQETHGTLANSTAIYSLTDWTGVCKLSCGADGYRRGWALPCLTKLLVAHSCVVCSRCHNVCVLQN